jgi:hypothetical protein
VQAATIIWDAGGGDGAWSTAINWNNAPTIGSTLLGAASTPTPGAYNEITLDPSAISGNGLVTFAIKSSGTNSMIANSTSRAGGTVRLRCSMAILLEIGSESNNLWTGRYISEAENCR